MRIVQSIIRLLLAGSVVTGLAAEPVHASGESYAFGHEVIGQAEKVLKQAGMNSPKWHSRQDSIQRDVHDITFLLEQALRAS